MPVRSTFVSLAKKVSLTLWVVTTMSQLAGCNGFSGLTGKKSTRSQEAGSADASVSQPTASDASGAKEQEKTAKDESSTVKKTADKCVYEEDEEYDDEYKDKSDKSQEASLLEESKTDDSKCENLGTATTKDD